MSIRPGSRIASPRSMTVALRAVAADADDPVVLDRGRSPGRTISPASTSSRPAALRVSTSLDHRLLDQLDVGRTAVEHAWLLPHLDRELTMTIDCTRCTSALASSGIPSSGNRAST